MPEFNAQDFARKWGSSRLKERSGSQEHFTDLCRLLGHATPAQADPRGEFFTFEKGAAKQFGGEGWADVWYKGHFAWEYKGRHADLDAAYRQLLQYREDLENPPLLIVSDMDRFEVHCNFTGSPKRCYRFDLAALAGGLPAEIFPPSPSRSAAPSALRVLEAAFRDPDSLRPREGQDFITQAVADYIGKVADSLRLRGVDATRAARFLMKVIFCFFAEDAGLLPGAVFQKILDRTRADEAQFVRYTGELFTAMAQGGHVLLERIPHFDGGLFSDSEVVPLQPQEIELLGQAAAMDWSSVEPAIFGTLFERCLDPDKHEQIGRHYTYADDIAAIVEPVLVAPLAAEWEALAARIEKAEAVGAGGAVAGGGAVTSGAVCRSHAPDGEAKSVVASKARQTTAPAEQTHPSEPLLRSFQERLASVRVLDPACGSGNFLYVSLRRLLDLEKRLVNFAFRRGVQLEYRVSPTQLHGMEISHFAHELASVVVWIGYLQWMRDNGAPRLREPILQPIETIHLRDAILAPGAAAAGGAVASGAVRRSHASDSAGRNVVGSKTRQTKAPAEPDWPEADFIVGNPPFVGGKKLRAELGDEAVDALFRVYEGRVPHEADLCCYWFEKARDCIERASKEGRPLRAGLLATQAIRGGANRKVLRRIQETGGVFMAWADRPWVLDGAAVRVSMVGFDDGRDKSRTLDGRLLPPGADINADLTSAADTTSACVLPENRGVSFMGDTKGGPFDIPGELAREMLRKPNPHGKPNSDVVRPWANGLDITRRPRDMWIIDFGCDMPQKDAALYEAPFEYVKAKVKPAREKEQREMYRENWWLHVRPREDMRKAISTVSRFLAVTRVAKYRLFSWLTAPTLPDSSLIVFARSDDYFFGVLQGRIHEVWALEQGTQLESRPRYTPTTCFETFPFPWPLNQPPPGDKEGQAERIAAAAKRLHELREGWLNPERGSISVQERARRTLTNLYNKRPTWLADAHAELDGAVCAAYGWPADLADDEILRRLLELNLLRAAERE